MTTQDTISRAVLCDWLRGLADNSYVEPYQFGDWHPGQVLRYVAAAVTDHRVPGDSSAPLPEDLSLEAAERRAVVAAMRATKGCKREAARRLHIGKTTLYRKLSDYNVESWEWERSASKRAKEADDAA